MQTTKSYWQLVAAAGLVCAFIGSACTVTTSTDDDDDVPSAGKSGAGTAGGATAGTAGATAGSGGASAGAPAAGAGGAGDVPFPYECDGDTLGTPSSCEPSVGFETDVCALCVEAKCCAEFGACYAVAPGNQCGYGGPAKVGNEENVGEIPCVQDCLQKGFEANGVVDEDLLGECYSKCTTTKAHGATTECGAIIGTQTSELTNCLVDKCQTECIGG